MVSIADDGAGVAYTDPSGVHLLYARTDGSGGHNLVSLNDRGIKEIHLASTTGKIYFLLGSDMNIGTAGLWVVNTDGSGLKQVASLKAITAFLKTPGQNDYFNYSTGWPMLNASADGSRIIFDLDDWDTGLYVLGINSDGTGLHAVLGPMARRGGYTAGISGDGSTVCYNTNPPNSNNQIGVMNFDGSGQRVIVQNLDSTPAGNDFCQLSNDGSWLLTGDSGRLYRTDGSGFFFPLAQSTSGPWIGDGTWLATMNSSATRFLSVFYDPNGVVQMSTIDVNPSSVGVAPNISSASVNPIYLLTNGRNTVTATAKVTTGNSCSIGGCHWDKHRCLAARPMKSPFRKLVTQALACSCADRL